MTKAESSKASSKPEPKLQTITLKVFVHCEGCRRKIRRIIRVLDGVEDVVVDSAAGKVTVTGSNIDVKIILGRLYKYGKQAELWPNAKAGPISLPESAGGNKSKPVNSNIATIKDSSPKKKENAVGEMGEAKPENAIGSESKKGSGKKGEESPAAANQTAQKTGGGTNEPRSGQKIKPEDTKETKTSVAEGGDACSPQENGGNGGGSGKKGKKGGNGPSNGGGGGGGGGAAGGGAAGAVREQPPPLQPPPPPPHSHNVRDIPITSLPVTTQVTVSANRAPAPYDYIQTGYSDYNTVDYATNMFSDENANNCSIM